MLLRLWLKGRLKIFQTALMLYYLKASGSFSGIQTALDAMSVS